MFLYTSDIFYFYKLPFFKSAKEVGRNLRNTFVLLQPKHWLPESSLQWDRMGNKVDSSSIFNSPATRLLQVHFMIFFHYFTLHIFALDSIGTRRKSSCWKQWFRKPGYCNRDFKGYNWLVICNFHQGRFKPVKISYSLDPV